MTIQILDQSMAVMQIQENELQLAAGAAFWMAAKVDGFDVNTCKLDVSIIYFVRKLRANYY